MRPLVVHLISSDGKRKFKHTNTTAAPAEKEDYMRLNEKAAICKPRRNQTF